MTFEFFLFRKKLYWHANFTVPHIDSGIISSVFISQQPYRLVTMWKTGLQALFLRYSLFVDWLKLPQILFSLAVDVFNHNVKSLFQLMLIFSTAAKRLWKSQFVSEHWLGLILFGSTESLSSFKVRIFFLCLQTLFKESAHYVNTKVTDPPCYSLP